MNSKFFILILSFFIFITANALPEGTYNNLSQPGMKIQLSHGAYKLWIEAQRRIINIQEGTYKIERNTIYFNPEKSEIGDLTSIQSKIIGKCKFEMGKAGIFKAEKCETLVNKNLSHIKNFPKKWKVYKTKGIEIYAPVGSKIEFKNNKFSINYKNSYGKMIVSQNPEKEINKIFQTCKPKTILKRNNTYFSLCEDGNFLEIVIKKGTPSLISYVKSKDFIGLKALSIAISSLTFEHKVKKLLKWTPRDNSFIILIPEGWKATGGTADFGANGYIRIVLVYPPDQSKAFLGVYYPFYGYVQSYYGNQGIPPMNPIDYMKYRFFQDLAQNYKITFENLNITDVKVDEKISQELVQQYKQIEQEYGMTVLPVDLKYFTGEGNFIRNGKEFEMKFIGIINNTTFPLQGMGYMYLWGPAPIIVIFSEKGKLSKWVLTFIKMANSWQVNMNWLRQHLAKANAEQQQIIEHYRRMSDMIHKNSERRLNEGMREWERQQYQENELFYDTFYALGGEERYDNPVTGEEIDVPTGADKYLYDNYSQTWIGIYMGDPDIINELKNNGFVELKKHRY